MAPLKYARRGIFLEGVVVYRVGLVEVDRFGLVVARVGLGDVPVEDIKLAADLSLDWGIRKEKKKDPARHPLLEFEQTLKKFVYSLVRETVLKQMYEPVSLFCQKRAKTEKEYYEKRLPWFCKEPTNLPLVN